MKKIVTYNDIVTMLRSATNQSQVLDLWIEFREEIDSFDIIQTTKLVQMFYNKNKVMKELVDPYIKRVN